MYVASLNQHVTNTKQLNDNNDKQNSGCWDVRRYLNKDLCKWFSLNMKKVILFWGFLLLLTTTEAQEDKIFSDYSVEIKFSCDSNAFPSSWLNKEINAKATNLDSNEIVRSKKIISKALLKYPINLVKLNLTKIYILKSLEFYGQPYGGTNSKSCIYLSNKGIQEGYTDSWIEQKFHSEFSSIFYRNYSFLFDKTKWISSNDSDIKYGNSGVDAIRNGKAITLFDMELNKKGILYLYAISSIEEDFNSYAENIFLSSLGFWEITDMHKKVKKKMIQVVDFYHKINKSFNLEYFKSISIK